jgi:hypothetical protein
MRATLRVSAALARRVMQAHLAYLLLLPLLACVAMGFSPELLDALFYGWLPWVIYALTVGTTYAISTHPLRMAATVLAVPVELALENVLFHRSIGFYFMEAAFVAVSALMGGLFLAMAVFRPSGWFGACFGAALLGCAMYAFGQPLLVHYQALQPLAAAMLMVAWLTALWSQYQLVMPSARSWVGGRAAPPPLQRFDGGWIARLLTPAHDEVFIGPGVTYAARAAARKT